MDYAATNKKFSQQKAALTRAINSGDYSKIEAACRKAVKEWDTDFKGGWPDDWSRWERALNDAKPWNAPYIDLRDLV